MPETRVPGICMISILGARGRSRTCDFLLRRQALYPLSYTRIFINRLGASPL